MDDGSKKARNLSVISFVICLYVLGGATLEGSGSLLGGSVKFERPWVLELAAMLLLLFYLYRLWLDVGNPMIALRALQYDFIASDTRFIGYVLAEGNRVLYEGTDPSGFFVNGKNYNNGSSHAKAQDVRWGPKEQRLQSVRPFKRYVVLGVVDSGSRYICQADVPLSWWACEKAEALAMVKAITLRQLFWEGAFPMLLSAVAGGLVLWRNLA